MVQVYHLQKAHPDAGRFRLWSLVARSDILERTVGRIMALNKLVYDDIPHVRKRGGKRVPGLHPYKASHRHQYWFIDGRQLDVRVDGVKWWSLIILEGYSRTILAGAIAPTEATWAALMALYTACLRYEVPDTLVSDSGGGYTSNDFEAVCTRLQLRHEAIQSTKGESYQNLMEAHFNIQRRLYDYQFSLTTTPLALEQRHQAFIQTYNTTAHPGLWREQFTPPIPLEVLGAAQGRVYTEEELSRKFDHHLLPRRTNQYGGVTLHSYHCAVEEGENDAAMAEQARTLIALRKSAPAWKALLDKAALEADAALHTSARYEQVGVDVGNGWQRQENGGLWGADWFGRAQAAVVYILVNDYHEAIYLIRGTDAKDALLDGKHRYTWTFPKDALPPVDRSRGGFWSLTMYDKGYFMLPKSPNGHTNIGTVSLDANELTFAADGSLTITISHEQPADAEARANWLPAPDGQLALIVRAYAPTQPIFDGSYKLPNVQRAP